MKNADGCDRWIVRVRLVALHVIPPEVFADEVVIVFGQRISTRAIGLLFRHCFQTAAKRLFYLALR